VTDFPADERPTGTLCLACGGDGKKLTEEGSRYAMKRCIWCTGGVMTTEQLAAWKNRSQR